LETTQKIEQTRILLVDDDRLTRNGTKVDLAVSGLFEVTGEAENGKDALKLIEALNPDLVLFDVRMPVMDGPHLAREIADRYPSLKRIVLTSFRDVFYLQLFLGYRVQGYMHKSCSEQELRQAILTVMKGGIAISPYLDDDPDDTLGVKRTINQKVLDLTNKERRALRALLMEGGTNKHLAELLQTTEKSVSFHLSNVYRKLEVERRGDLIKQTNKWLMILSQYPEAELSDEAEL